MAKASGRYNACSDWLRARAEQGITHPKCQRADYGLCELGLGFHEIKKLNNLDHSVVMGKSQAST